MSDRTLSWVDAEAGSEPAGQLPTGTVVGRLDDPDQYELVSPGVRGGEGVVHRARYRGGLATALDEYAVKLVDLGDDHLDRSRQLRRAWDGLRMLELVNHPHLVRVFDVFAGPPPHTPGMADRDAAATVPYVLMEWVDGPSLAELGRTGRIGWADALTWTGQLAAAVAELHSATRRRGNPMLHRDIKPLNALVHPDRGLVLVDVGGLQLVTARDPRGMLSTGYVAPEVLADPVAARDTASDLFSVGAVAYFALTGDEPGDVRTADGQEHMLARATDAARRAGVADPGRFAQHLLGMLSADPLRRPGDLGGWAEQLAVLGAPAGRRTPGAVHRHHRGRRAGVVAVALVGMLLALQAPLAESAVPGVDPSALGGGDTAVADPGDVPAEAAPATPQEPAPEVTGAEGPVEAAATGPAPAVPAGGAAPPSASVGAPASPAQGTAPPVAQPPVAVPAAQPWTALYQGTSLSSPAMQHAWAMLDEGMMSTSSSGHGQDAWYSPSKHHPDLSFTNRGAVLGSGATPSADACSGALGGSTVSHVELEEIPLGSVLCTRTDQGNVAAVRLDSLPGDGSLGLTAWAWRPTG